MKTVEDVVVSFQPSRERARRCDWANSRAEIQQIIRDTGFESIKATKDAMYSTVGYLCWLKSIGRGASLKDDMVPSLVERYFEVRSKKIGKARPGTERSILRRIGRAVNPKAGWLPGPTHRPRRRVQPPYKVGELAGLEKTIDWQPSPLMRRRGSALLGLCGGCGFWPSEVIRVTGGDVTVDADGVLRVHVKGSRERQVPVLEAFRPRVEALAADAGPNGKLIGPITIEQGDPVGKAILGLKMPEGATRLSLPRLRTTWMVAVLNSGVNTAEFLYLAGLKSLQCVVDLSEWITVRPDQMWRDAASGTPGV